MIDLTLSAEQIRQFDEDGYLILENLLDPEDVEQILRIARCDPRLAADAKGNQNYEGEGLDTRLAYRPGLAANTYVLPDWPDDQCPRIEKWDDSEVAAAAQRHWEAVAATNKER